VEAAMILEYISKAIERTTYKKLDDGSWFAEIPGFEGVWANAPTVELCRKELIEVLEEWLLLKVRDRDKIPAVDGIQLCITRDSAA
jgi:predicted RNase H-like HicB family nuclease